jgi:glycosyltransferase involved in cell wall biosynthesis
MTHNHALTVASRALERIALDMGIPAERVSYVPNGPGIPDREGNATERAATRARLDLGERPTLLLYSRLFEFDTARLLAVVQGIRAAVPDLALLSIGAGLFAADSAALQAGLDEAGLREAVVELGWVEPDALPGTLAAADVGLYLMDDVLLNRTKCPVKLVDMLLAGVPVVGEAVGQVPETVRDGETGWVLPGGDVEGLVAAAVRLLGDPAERARMAAAARDDARERFNWDALADRLLPAYGVSS